MIGSDSNEAGIRVENPITGRALTAWICRQGDDLVVSVGGGERPHVGCVVMAEPVPPRRSDGSWSASVSVLTIAPHKEEAVARGIAERLAVGLRGVVVVTAGVHDDGLDRAGIQDYLELAGRLGHELVAHLE